MNRRLVHVTCSAAFAVLASLGAVAEAKPRPRPTAAVALPGGPGHLRNAAQGLCLDVAGWNAQGDANVALWSCNGDPDQVWNFAQTGELLNATNAKCLDVAGYDGQQGANVDTYHCEGLDDQRWFLVARGPGTFEVRSRKQGLCLDVNGKAGNQGDNVLLWACDGGRDQLWSWEPVAAQPAMVPEPRHHRPIVDPPEPYPTQPVIVGPAPVVRPVVVQPAPVVRPVVVQPVVVREQPVPVAHPMNPQRFQALLSAIDNEGFSQNKLQVLEQAASGEYFLVEQTKQVIGKLPFSADKLHALEVLAPRILDRKNSFTLFEAFTFSSDKDQARAILQRNGY